MGRHEHRGYTLIEMMVALSIAAILLGIAVPSFKEASLSSQLRSLSTELIAGMNLARSEAIKRNDIVSMCVSTDPDGKTCTAGSWHQGWIVKVGADTVIKRVSPAPSGFKINASAALTALSFQPTGVGATAVTLTVCRATPSVGPQEREVRLDAAGRSYASRTNTGTCS